MVEGPGCKLKGEKIGGRLKGQRVTGVDGTAVRRPRRTESSKKGKKPCPDDNQHATSPFDEVLCRECCDVQTLGKELFMYFDNASCCIRVHFLMSGGFRINGQDVDRDGGADGEKPILLLQMSKDTLTFNSKCAVDTRPAADCREKVSSMLHLDICSDTFSHKSAVGLMMTQLTRLVCDVLLDQLILPGVGNIIKNEALFDSGINPNSKVGDLSEAHVSHLIKMTRDFTMIFYKCRKEGKSLGPYLKIYRKTKCKQCSGKVINTRMGESSERLTSFCQQCQTNDLQKLQNRVLPAKNSLLGWVKSGTSNQQASQTNWTCKHCTLINKYSRSNCSACLAPRQQFSVSATENNTSQSATNYKKPRLSQEVPENRWRTEADPQLPQLGNIQRQTQTVNTMAGSWNGTQESSSRTAHLLMNNSQSPYSTHSVASHQTKQSPNEIGKTTNSEWKNKFSSSPSVCSPGNSNVQMRKPLVTHNASVRSSPGLHASSSKSTIKSTGSANVDDTTSDAITQAATCPEHKAVCIMREVRKKGPNLGRMFYSCRRGRQCSFFKWADEAFPLCEGHGKKCVLRTVMKQGVNNGRRFFACGQGKNKQCQTFQWADEYQKMTIR